MNMKKLMIASAVVFSLSFATSMAYAFQASIGKPSSSRNNHHRRTRGTGFCKCIPQITSHSLYIS